MEALKAKKHYPSEQSPTDKGPYELPHGHAGHAGLKSGGGKHKALKPPTSRWPKEAKNWNGAKRKAFAKEIQRKHPGEDPEYGMPD